MIDELKHWDEIEAKLRLERQSDFIEKYNAAKKSLFWQSFKLSKLKKVTGNVMLMNRLKFKNI
eukprot:CAMPEP_0168330366 /NCGR_PEP_ID=MMETSP0213-20121227/7686_1 /TAXON_ID=151035 /ORGANISM="Euplotes harpa, Strain FSP1.4" /LENGTH=62 /DNA_ID=CAMNT_0008333919 /DNA_START=562 /DNA_END=750 /DNA_ORIENTATION=+